MNFEQTFEIETICSQKLNLKLNEDEFDLLLEALEDSSNAIWDAGNPDEEDCKKAIACEELKEKLKTIYRKTRYEQF